MFHSDFCPYLELKELVTRQIYSACRISTLAPVGLTLNGLIRDPDRDFADDSGRMAFTTFTHLLSTADCEARSVHGRDLPYS